MTLVQDLDKGILSSLSTYEAGALQASAHRNLQKYSDEVLHPFGITKIQWLIIGSVSEADNGYVEPAELAELLGTTRLCMDESIEQLVSKSILHRHGVGPDIQPQAVRIDSTFTPKIVQIENVFRDTLRQKIYAKVSPEDLRTYMRVVYRLSKVAS